MPEFNIPPRKEGIYIQMPKADLELVLATLRHPDNASRQGVGSMFDGSGYCCLGAMQCAKTGGKIEADYTSFSGFRSAPSKTWLRSVGWAFYSEEGLSTRDPYLPTTGRHAISANDNVGMSFSQIADAIEACAEGY